MRGRPCPAGPSGKLGPWRRGLNWPRCATSDRQNKTAAEGKPPRPFWGHAAGMESGAEKWSWIGEARRAAVVECQRGGGGQIVPPPTACIARGPDGTKGFCLRRTRSAVLEEEPVTQVKTNTFADFLRSDIALGLFVVSITVLFVVLFPWLGVTAFAFFALDSIGHLKPELTHSIAATLEVAGGLILGLGVVEWGVETLTATPRIVCAGGVPVAATLALALTASEWLSRHRHIDAVPETTLVSGVEEEEEEEEREKDVLSGNRMPDAYPPGADVVLCRSVAATEAGQLRRRASAVLQNKVFDPGGQ